jgi:hypothetical protein
MFSSSARRYVLRPDHPCLWTASWIGKLNHKFFLLLNIYGIMDCGCVGAFSARYAIDVFRHREVTFLAILFALFAVAGIAFIGLTGRFCINSLRLGIHNRTNWEDWNQVAAAPFEHGSVIANLADIMGPLGCMWFCRVSPWPDASIDTLAADYPSYDELSP